MRLTLRTLLAYLDNTLDPGDAQILRSKLEQSGFATQLVQNIRASLAAKNLSAPAPDSVHPVEEPNMMSDFLDSTLSPEQIAEVEKVCLESLPHLAEAAACHQILTMVLGQPASASDELKHQIYSMVDEHGNVRPATPSPPSNGTSEPGTAFGASPPVAGGIGPRFSNIDIDEDSASSSNSAHDLTSGDASPAVSPDDQPTISLPQDAATGLPNGDFADTASALTNVRPTPPPPTDKIQPVGADDSGVFEAANILREQSQQFAEAGTALDDAEPFPGGRSLKNLERSDYYEGSVRPSRIAPWLVSLALVGALLFAISQIFAPLLNPKVAKKEEEKVSAVYPDIPLKEGVPTELDTSTTTPAEPTSVGNITPPEEAPRPKANGPESVVADVASNDAEVSTTDSERTAHAIIPEGMPVDSIAMVPKVAVESTETLPDDAPDDAPESMPPKDLKSTLPSDVLDTDKASVGTETKAGAVPVGAMQTGAVETVEMAAASKSLDVAPLEAPATAMEPNDQIPEPVQVATLESDSVFFAVHSSDKPWALAKSSSALMSGDTLVCGPEFRADITFASDPECRMTVVGPTQFVLSSTEESVAIAPLFGKGMIRIPSAGKTLQVLVDGHPLTLTAESDNSTVAFDVARQRELGDDPNVPQNHSATIQLLTLAGKVAVETGDNKLMLGTSQQALIQISESELRPGESEKSERTPSWCDPESDTGTLESDAAADLLELVRADDANSLMLSLKVALDFRRNEVAALAGKTMLAMGDASAYFGVDGLLSKPKQRLYWASHFKAIREMVDRSVESAKAVRTAIAGQNQAIDDADGDTLFRLLVGYSADQLSTGGDAELVEGLESASVPVRVLASEHLREISGTTLFFKPEETVEARREEIIKKWKVRLRKEAIRWPDQ